MDKVLFEFFDLHAGKTVTQKDLTQMLMNLPLDGMIVDFGTSRTSKQAQYKIMKSPPGVEGVRNKRKLL